MNELSLTGFWWDPQDTAARWPGTLTFDPASGARLRLTMPVNLHRLFGPRASFEILHGETTGGAPVTLVNAFEQGGDALFANVVLTGLHAEGPDPLVNAASAVITNLDAWWGRRGFEPDASLAAPHFGVRYVRPDPVTLHQDGIFKTVVLSHGLPDFGPKAVSIEEQVAFELTATPPQPLSAFRRRIHALEDFLSIVALGLCRCRSFTFVVPGPAGRSGLPCRYYGVPLFKTAPDPAPDLLFRLPDIGEKAPSIVGAWIANAERLGAVRALYMVGAHDGGYLETRFLALAQAAEAYHRRIFAGEDLYMDAERYRGEALPAMLAAIPQALSPDHRQALRSRLTFGNEVAFRKRLQKLFDENQAALAEVCPDPKRWIEPIKDLRNKLTHHPVVGDDAFATPDLLLRCNMVLRTLLELCFLRAMGFDAEATRAVAAGNDRYQAIRRRFFGP